MHKYKPVIYLAAGTVRKMKSTPSDQAIGHAFHVNKTIQCVSFH